MSIITLITDFGNKDHFVAKIKGNIYSNFFNAKIVEISNDVSPFNIMEAAYILENAYPYAIDAVPLSYGVSQITRVNVNFHYSRHTVVYGDIIEKGSGGDGLTGTLLNSDFADNIPPTV